jgi:hypothetical protein
LPKSFVKTAGHISIQANGNITLGTGTEMDTLGSNILVRAGEVDSGVVLSGNLLLGDNSKFFALGGNISCLASGNVTGGATGSANTFFAQAFTTGGGGGVEVRAGTTVSNIAALLSTRPVPATVLPATPNSVFTVNSLTPDALSKGLIDFSTATSGASSTVNFRKGVVVFSAANGAVNTVNDDTITSIVPISAGTSSDSADIVVDTEDDAAEAELALK